ncbi:hypothetical protein [Heyndrickxia coagulans]|nr:hypothetical protein [Heyndrickxia coagulans]
MTVAEVISEKKYGSLARSVNEMIARLVSVPWYSNAGRENPYAEQKIKEFATCFGTRKLDVKWISKEKLGDTAKQLTFEGCELWNVLKDIPDQLKVKIDVQGKGKILEDLVYKMPEAIFHRTFDQAYAIFGDRETVQFLIGHAMYIGLLYCLYELAEEENPVSFLLDILEAGNIPLGPDGNIFYLV